MGLSAEERKTLDELTKKSKEPDTPPANISYTLDLSSDSGWERAKKLGLVSDPAPSSPSPLDDDPDAAPRRKGFFGDQQQV